MALAFSDCWEPFFPSTSGVPLTGFKLNNKCGQLSLKAKHIGTGRKYIFFAQAFSTEVPFYKMMTFRMPAAYNNMSGTRLHLLTPVAMYIFATASDSLQKYIKTSSISRTPYLFVRTQGSDMPRVQVFHHDFR